MSEVTLKAEEDALERFGEEEGGLLEVCLGIIDFVGGNISRDPDNPGFKYQEAQMPEDNPNTYKVRALLGNTGQALEKIVITGERLMDDTGVGQFRLEMGVNAQSIKLFEFNPCSGGFINKSYLLRMRPDLLIDLASELAEVFNIQGSCL